MKREFVPYYLSRAALSAIFAAAVVGILLYVVSLQASTLWGTPVVTGPLALSMGIIAYFITQIVLFARE
jgi:hypothetical protein